MDQIISELEQIKNDAYSLDFHYPSKDEVVELAVSTDALVEDEVIEEFEDLRAALKKAKGHWEQLPLDLRNELASLSGGEGE